MIQRKIVSELIGIYKKTENKNNQKCLFYRDLKNEFISKIKDYADKEEILEGYKVACQSYLDSNLLETNISIAALLLSITGLLQLIDLKWSIDVKCILGIIITGFIIWVPYWSIRTHMKQRKLLEIYHVLEKIKIENNPGNEKNCDKK